MRTTTIRTCGALVALGAVTWSVTWLVAGPPEEGRNAAVEIWGSAAFQLGLVALLVAMRGTDAAGASRWGRRVVTGEAVLLGLAIAWTVPHLGNPNYQDDHGGALLTALDAAWPLSMLGLVVVGVFVLRARRWPGALRWLPLAASLLIPLDILVMLVAGPWGQIVVRAVYMTLTYGAMGLLLLRGDVAGVDRTLPSPARPATAVG